MIPRYEFDFEHVSQRIKMARKMSKCELYSAIRVYLKKRIEVGGKEVMNLEDEISTGFEFDILEREVIQRGIDERTMGADSEYFKLFQDNLIKAGIMKKKIFPVGFYS